MKKVDFLKFFKDEDENFIGSLYEKVYSSQRSGQAVFTKEFISYNLCQKISEIATSEGIEVKLYGGFKEYSRAIIGFNNIYDYEPPYSLLEINFTTKFENISHRDILGSLLSCGIAREKFGDLILKDQKAYIPVVEELEGLILNHLTKIKHTGCKVNIIDRELGLSIEPDFLSKEVLITTMRLDSVIAALINKSRSNAVEMIQSAKIKINENEFRDKSLEVKYGDVITIRGFGKFKVVENISKTKSNRNKILIKKYI